ncbi:MAG TPA: ABC transporter permease subunit [Burkholderiales bacterium]|nr:ABC transporter permease subunit [Burkholderiales bacterium]
MMRTLFMKEIREALASRRFWVILALCLVLIPLGVEVSLKDYQTRLQNYREAVRIYQEETKLIQDVLYKGGAKAFAPPSPLGFLSRGLELILPNIAETPARRTDPPVGMRLGNNQGRDNLYEFFYGPLDLIFIVGVVMSFLAIILTYGAVAGEKEQGTLRQVLSNSVPRAKIILAKATANGLVLIIPFLLALTLSLTVLEVQGSPLAALAGAWTSIGLSVLICVLFIGTFFSLGLLVSALTKQAVPALITLLLAWVFLYGVYPRLSAAAAQILYPVKSDARIALEKAQIQRDVNKDRDAEIEKVAQTMPPRDFESQTFKDGEAKQAEIRSRYQAKLEASWKIIDRDVEERRKSKNTLTANIARLSPVSLFIRPLAELSRTGWLEYQQFQTEVRQYEGVLNRDIFGKDREVHMNGGAMVSNAADPNAPAPVFTYVRTPEDGLVQNVLPDVLLLVLLNLIFFAGAFVAFLGYDVR